MITIESATCGSDDGPSRILTLERSRLEAGEMIRREAGDRIEAYKKSMGRRMEAEDEDRKGW